MGRRNGKLTQTIFPVCAVGVPKAINCFYDNYVATHKTTIQYTRQTIAFS